VAGKGALGAACEVAGDAILVTHHPSSQVCKGKIQRKTPRSQTFKNPVTKEGSPANRNLYRPRQREKRQRDSRWQKAA